MWKKISDWLINWLKTKVKTWIVKVCINLFGRNYWGWAHLTFSAIACSVWFRVFPHSWNWETLKWSLSIVLFVALFWEMVEFIFEISMKGKTVKDVYGSYKHYWQDTLGDIILAIIGFGIALI